MDQDFFPANRPEWSGTHENTTGFVPALPDRGIDLNEQLIKNKPATFFMRVNSNAMIGAGIHHGDIVIVDRSIEPLNEKVVIAIVDGEMLIRRLVINNNRKRLVPATSNLSPIDITDATAFSIWGTVTYVIHSV
jgi:DNA polymerase V